MSDSNLDTVTQDQPLPDEREPNLTGSQEESPADQSPADPVGSPALQDRQKGFDGHEET